MKESIEIFDLVAQAAVEAELVDPPFQSKGCDSVTEGPGEGGRVNRAAELSGTDMRFAFEKELQ